MEAVQETSILVPSGEGTKPRAEALGEGEVLGVTETEAGDTLEPAALEAVTVNVYEVPFVRPETVSGEPEPVAVKPPGELVAVYEVAPGRAVNETVTCVSPAATVGAARLPSGVAVTEEEAAEMPPVPEVSTK